MSTVHVITPCQKLDPDLWFSEDKKDIATAIGICNGCPFKEECLRQAEENKEVHGVWGGKNFNTKLALSTNKARGLCHSGRHDKPYPGQCKPCRAETQANYNKRRKRKIRKPETRKRSSWKKNTIGDFCHKGHYLTINNTRVRPNDGALMCSQCFKRIQPSIRKKRIEADTWRLH